jgi:hypothetical protein
MPVPITEESVLQALRRVPAERWSDVLHYLHSLQPVTAAGVDPATLAHLADTVWTAAALRPWPRPVQDAILREQAARLVAHSQRDPHFTQPTTWWTAGDIGRLPLDQRDILLQASATVAADEYATNADLTAFDAFGEDDLPDDSASTEPRGPIARIAMKNAIVRADEAP